MAEFVKVYPPDIPILIPYETITKANLKYTLKISSSASCIRKIRH
ncbi:hypothetical protein ABHM95_17595 [Solibacillus isronensis]